MEELKVAATIPASADELYHAWLDSAKHSAFTGSPARCSAKKGGSFTTWDGYISGKNIDLVPSSKIIQAWRTTEFDPADPDSILHMLFEETKPGKTKVTFIHTNIPAGQGASYKSGWKDFYFDPMKAYYGAQAKK